MPVYPDPIITPEIFAQSIVDDYALAPSYHVVITKAIQDQLSDYKAHSTTFGGDPDSSASFTFPEPLLDNENEVVAGEMDDEEAKWWAAWRKHVRSRKILVPKPITKVDSGSGSRKKRKVVKDEVTENEDVLMAPPPVPASSNPFDVPVRVEDYEEDESKMQEEMRILIKVSLRLSFYTLACGLGCVSGDCGR